MHRRPKVAVLGTGDELVAPGSKPAPGEIVYSNGFALMAMARSEGAEVERPRHRADRVEDIAAAVRRARDWGADILLTSGGASVGEHDLVQRALAAEGLDLSFWRVALRPGRPMMHGRLGAMQVLGVPGNPVSSYVCAFLFLVPLIRRLVRPRATSSACPSRPGSAATCRPMTSGPTTCGRPCPAGPEGLVATPLPDQDSSLMAPLAKADCLLIREPNAPAAAAGSPCVILKLGL